MSQFLLRGAYGDKSKEKKSAPTLQLKQHTNIRFINKRTDDAQSVGNISTPALSSSSVPSSSATLSSFSTIFPSGPCSSIIYKSFGERADSNGYSWATLSDETKILYWDEFHKKCYWDDAKTSLTKAC